MCALSSMDEHIKKNLFEIYRKQEFWKEHNMVGNFDHYKVKVILTHHGLNWCCIWLKTMSCVLSSVNENIDIDEASLSSSINDAYEAKIFTMILLWAPLILC